MGFLSNFITNFAGLLIVRKTTPECESACVVRRNYLRLVCVVSDFRGMLCRDNRIGTGCVTKAFLVL